LGESKTESRRSIHIEGHGMYLAKRQEIKSLNMKSLNAVLVWGCGQSEHWK
jgi:hypothetical protein